MNTKASAIWILAYDIAHEHEQRYLDWFHSEHIPEKLARPGYTWAAHFRGASTSGHPSANGFVAMFGGESTRTFLNPSPAQLKTRQDARTREMMGLRVGSRAMIVCEEWSEGSGPGGVPLDQSPAIDLATLDVDSLDERLSAWCVQEAVPTALASDSALRATKCTNVMGRPRHALVLQRAGGTEPIPALDTQGELGGIVTSELKLTFASGKRIWPLN